jgi:hypothetical protein
MNEEEGEGDILWFGPLFLALSPSVIDHLIPVIYHPRSLPHVQPRFRGFFRLGGWPATAGLPCLRPGVGHRLFVVRLSSWLVVVVVIDGVVRGCLARLPCLDVAWRVTAVGTNCSQ